MNRCICIILLLLVGTRLMGQTHDWAFDIKNASGSARINAQAVDDSSNVYIGGVFQGVMYLGTDTFTFSSSTNFAIFFAKYDKDGNYIWGKAITSAQTADLADIVINSKNQIILFGRYRTSGTSTVSFGSTTLSKSDAVFVAFMDASGNFTSAKDLGYGSFTTASGIALGKDDEIHAVMYLNGFGTGWRIVNGTSTTNGTGFVNVVAKFSADATSLSWSKSYSIYDLLNIYDIAVDRHNQVYFTCAAATSTTIFGFTTPASNATNFIVWLRPNGDFKDKIVAISANSAAGSSIATAMRINNIVALDSTRIYISGNAFYDSLTIKNSKIYTVTISSTYRFFNWVAELSNFDTLSWYRSTSDIFNSNSFGGDMKINGDFLYLSTLQNSSGFSFGGFSTSSYVASVVSKLDRLGNVLWYIPIGSSIPPKVSGIGSQDMVYSGGYTSTLSLSPFTLNNTTGVARPFVARTYDYSITRGEVSEGPYCAGDTIYIPYEKVGDFDTSNIFIAEISDENGEFFGGQRELGRLKTNKDSTVAGALPLFQVASSSKYRIRITSTSPTVQSYYRLDTLNLLIYSRDKADPGSDTSICLGDTLQLNTFGGTQWSWSPSYAMSDSTLRNPRVWPTSDTIYQIIISDSSGCGAPDTASIKVKIKEVPKFTSSNQSDSVVCKGDMAVLKNTFSGANDIHYISWYKANNQRIKGTATDLNSDSLVVFPLVNTGYYAVLTDSCATISDTLFYQVAVFDSLKVYPNFTDSLVCKNQEILLSASVTYPKIDSVFFVWTRLGSSTSLGSDSQIFQRFQANAEIQLKVENRCVDELQLFNYSIETHPEILNSITEFDGKTVLCRGDSFVLISAAKGGKVDGNLQVAWYLNELIGSADTIVVFADSLAANYPGIDSFEVTAITTDNCTLPNDTTNFIFSVLPQLSIDSIWGLDSILCQNVNQIVYVSTSGGLGENAYQVDWIYNNNTIGRGDSLLLVADSFNAGEYTDVSILLHDGCSTGDTFRFRFFVPNELQLNSNLEDTLVCNGEILEEGVGSKGGDSTNYSFLWKVNNQIVSNADSFYYVFLNEKSTSDSIYLVKVEVGDGCAVNTAADSFIVTVAPNPTISFMQDSITRLQSSDTLLCRGESIRLKTTTFYHPSNLSSQLFRDGSLVSDSGVFELLDTENIIADSVVFLATYNSVCGTKVDSAICIVYLRKPLDIVPIGDTTLCHNTSATFSANATGGNPNQYTYTWINKSDFSVRSANQVLDLKNVETDALMRLVVKDGCTSPYDSIDFNVQVLAPLDVSLQTSSICADSIRIEAVGEGGKSSNYRYTWAQDNNQVANTSNTLMVFPTKQMQVWVAIADDCTSDAAYDSILVDTRPKFELNFAPDSVCEPFSIVWDDYIAQSSVATIEWKERNEANYKSILESAEYTNGAYNFTFIATNSLGCSNTLNQDVFVKPLPDASFSWLPIEPDFDNPLVRFKAAARADETTWVIEGKRFAEITDSFRYTFNKVGEYAVGMVVMKDGCIDSAFQSLTFKDVFRYFDITAFTPNKDGLNDYFTPSLSGVQTYEYEVYNSWGEKIFVGNQNSGGWDGTFMGKAVPDGYYIIRLSAQKSNGTNFYTSGIIHLIR